MSYSYSISMFGRDAVLNDIVNVAVEVETTAMYDVSRNIEDEQKRTKHQYLGDACGAVEQLLILRRS